MLKHLKLPLTVQIEQLKELIRTTEYLSDRNIFKDLLKRKEAKLAAQAKEGAQ